MDRPPAGRGVSWGHTWLRGGEPREQQWKQRDLKDERGGEEGEEKGEARL